MSPEEISFWSMIGTWVSGIATSIAVVISLWLASYTRKAKLNLELKISRHNDATLKLINTSNIMATVENISLSTSKRVTLINRRADDLLATSFMYKDSEDVINEKTILPNGHYKEFKIDFSSLKDSYSKFLPYDNDGFLTRVIKMPKAYILVRIVGGQTFHIKIEPLFFERYKNDDCLRLEEALKQATESPELYLSYKNENELNERQLERLDWYIRSKKNSLYLIQ